MVDKVKGFRVVNSDCSSGENLVSALEGFVGKFYQVVGCTATKLDLVIYF